MDEYVEVDLEDVERFIHNSDFHYYLLNNVTDFNTAAFILQTLINTVEEIKKQYQVEDT